MTTRRYALRDDQWARIAGLPPGRAGHVGGTAPDNQLFVDAIPYRYQAGLPWRNPPGRFREGRSVRQRSGRRARAGGGRASSRRSATRMTSRP